MRRRQDEGGFRECVPDEAEPTLMLTWTVGGGDRAARTCGSAPTAPLLAAGPPGQDVQSALTQLVLERSPAPDGPPELLARRVTGQR